MDELKEDFIENNKIELLKEIEESLAAIRNAIINAIQNTPTEKPEYDSAILRNSLIELSGQLGFLTACFQQYICFVEGTTDIFKKKPIGFCAIREAIKEKKKHN